MFTSFTSFTSIHQGCNARKVISQVYACFVLQCTVTGRGNVNSRWISKPDMGSIFHINNQWNILVIGNYYVNYQNYQNSMLLTSSDTKRTLMHQLLFTNSAQRELVSICTHSIRNMQLTFLALHSWHTHSSRRQSWSKWNYILWRKLKKLKQNQ